MNRIDLKFSLLKETGRKALITFITAGDPDLNTTVDLVLSMEEAGADIIELGIPYSDPLADGPVIQASSARALENGTKINKIMDTVKRIRQNSEIPLVYLVYYNSVFKYGIERFASECSQSGIDGLIIPDLPIEEREEILAVMDNYGICLIPLVAPTSKARIKKITQKGRGFVYCISVNGVTGARQGIETNIDEYMKTIAQYTGLPKVLGFGISSAAMVKELKAYCEGVIIGSAIVKRIAEAEGLEESVLSVSRFVSALREAL
jgi:tryptophan synthase alpha chain